MLVRAGPVTVQRSKQGEHEQGEEGASDEGKLHQPYTGGLQHAQSTWARTTCTERAWRAQNERRLRCHEQMSATVRTWTRSICANGEASSSRRAEAELARPALLAPPLACCAPVADEAPRSFRAMLNSCTAIKALTPIAYTHAMRMRGRLRS